MNIRILLAATLALPWLAACDKSPKTPTPGTASEERQSTSPPPTDRVLQGTPPAGVPPAGSAAAPPPSETPASDSGPGGSAPAR